MIKDTEITLLHIRAMLEIMEILEMSMSADQGEIEVTPSEIDYVINMFGVKAKDASTGLSELMAIGEYVNNLTGGGNNGGSSTDPLKEFDASIVAVSQWSRIRIDYSYPYLLFIALIELMKEQNKD